MDITQHSRYKSPKKVWKPELETEEEKKLMNEAITQASKVCDVGTIWHSWSDFY
jgi:hypothetical protein